MPRYRPHINGRQPDVQFRNVVRLTCRPIGKVKERLSEALRRRSEAWGSIDLLIGDETIETPMVRCEITERLPDGTETTTGRLLAYVSCEGPQSGVVGSPPAEALPGGPPTGFTYPEPGAECWEKDGELRCWRPR